MTILKPPKKFNPGRFEVSWDEVRDEFVAHDKQTLVDYAIPTHVLAVLQEEDYRLAAFAVQDFIRRTAH